MFDHASPIGELVIASPTYYRLEARFHGAAAHAGIRPEAGRNAIAAAARAVAAMPLGRLDEETTANVGLIEGGSAANVVAERCRVELEARSLDDGAGRPRSCSAMVDAATEAASDAECDVETRSSASSAATSCRAPRRRWRSAAARARGAAGSSPSYIATGGGSDANALIAAGLPVVNVANGTERNHQPDECVTVDALERMLDVTLAIVGGAAAGELRADRQRGGLGGQDRHRAGGHASATTTARRPSARSSRIPARWRSSPTTASAI